MTTEHWLVQWGNLWLTSTNGWTYERMMARRFKNALMAWETVDQLNHDLTLVQVVRVRP